MSSIDDVCQEVLRKVDDALGFAVVDLDSGLLLAAAHNVPYFTQSYLDAVAAAAVGEQAMGIGDGGFATLDGNIHR